MRVSHRQIGPAIVLGTAALLAACTPVAAPAPPTPPAVPQTVARGCDAAGATTSATPTAGSGTADQDALSAPEAAADADAAFATATDRLPDGSIPLVTIEQRGDSLEIDTTAVRSAEDAAEVATDAARGDDLVAVLPDSMVTTAAAEGPAASAATANDTERSRQWALDRAGFEAAWDLSDGDGVVVAVVDTGVQSAHPDLAGQVLPGRRFVGNGASGIAMDPAIDDNGHGTHVAGIIAAVANNAQGIAGGAPGTCILPVKVLNRSGSGWDSDVARGIDWAVSNGAQVINLSLGSGSPGASSIAVQNAVANDVMVFAAAGNDGSGASPEYPAADPSAIAVASVTSALARSSFSTTGAYVDIAAPGSSIYSTYTSPSYASLSGTSMATPYAAATGALVRGRYPAWTAAQARQRLLDTANDLGPPGPDNEFGYGFIDPLEATG